MQLVIDIDEAGAVKHLQITDTAPNGEQIAYVHANRGAKDGDPPVVLPVPPEVVATINWACAVLDDAKAERVERVLAAWGQIPQ